MAFRRMRLLFCRATLPLRLCRSLPPDARSLASSLHRAGHEAYLVGGCVRDLLLGRKPVDWDLATSAPVETILALFPEGRTMGAARAGTTVLIPRSGQPYEVTAYRGVSLTEDLSRRDFTINAMALDLSGRLVDPLGGQADLARGLVRACIDPRDRISEDPLRMLRAVRLAAQLDFSLDTELTQAIQESAPRLSQVAVERIGQEFVRLLVTDRPAWGMERLRELGLLEQFAPEFLETVGFEQNQYHRFPVWEHLLLALALVPPEAHLRLAALLHDVGKPRTLSIDQQGNRHFYRHEQVSAEMAGALMTRLRLDGATRSRVVHLVRSHMDLYLDGPVKDATIRRMIRRIGLENMHDLIQLRRADRLASGTREGDLSPETFHLLQQIQRVLAQDEALKVTDLAVNGHDVLRVFQRPPGPYVGQVLGALLDEVLEDPSRNNRTYLLRRLDELSMLW